MIKRKPVPAETLTDDYKPSVERELRKLDKVTIQQLEDAADSSKNFFTRVTNFIKGENKLGRRVGMIADIAMFFLPSGVRTGRSLARRILTKKHKSMSVLKDKPWYRSKTMWSALLLILTGLLQAAGVDLAANPELMDTVYQILYTLAGGFGLYGLRAAVADKTDNIKTEE